MSPFAVIHLPTECLRVDAPARAEPATASRSERRWAGLVIVATLFILVAAMAAVHWPAAG